MINLMTIRKGPAGKAVIIRDQAEKILGISLTINRKLESFRSKKMRGHNNISASSINTNAGESWVLLIRSLLPDNELAVLQRECALDGVKIEVGVVVKNRIAIRDTKDILTAFDHQILDNLVRAKILLNDDDNNLDVTKPRCEPAERYLFNGRDCVFVTFKRSAKPCRDSLTKRVQQYGWPCHKTMKELKGRGK